jgi:DNA-binding transcriptional MerR regulator
MRIGELARRTGVSPRLLRYYEQQHLLRPTRLASGYREYDEDAVETVRRIRLLLAAGLSTATIALILPCVSSDGDRLAPACPATVGRFDRERERITRQVRDLAESLRLLDEILVRTPPA